MRTSHFIQSLLIAGWVFTAACHQPEKNNATSMDSLTTTRPVSWAHQTNIYEVNVRQYTPEGTFNAFAGELPRLRKMGVETLWFMPITPIAQEKKKGSLGSYYACADYTAINPEFGNLDDFKNLVKKAHEMGFKVIIDWVANHTGWDHRWTKEHPDYYEHDSATGTFKIASGMDDIIELNFKNPALRRAMIDAMKYWVNECDIDGFRCDLAFWVELDFWKEARKELDAVKPLFWLGEFDELGNPDYGEVFDASYTWTWMHRAEEFYKKQEPLDSLTEVLKKYDAIGDGSMRAWFTTNHDENSWNGTEYEKYGDMAKALAVFSATWNGVPLVYSGQELPLRDKRIKFFDKDPIPWNGTYELEDFYSVLFHLKKENPALAAGDTTVQTIRLATTAPHQVLAYMRRRGDQEVVVILNLSKENKLHFEITDPALKGTYKNAFSAAPADFSNGANFEMGAWEYLVYVK